MCIQVVLCKQGPCFRKQIDQWRLCRRYIQIFGRKEIRLWRKSIDVPMAEKRNVYLALKHCQNTIVSVWKCFHEVPQIVRTSAVLLFLIHPNFSGLFLIFWRLRRQCILCCLFTMEGNSGCFLLSSQMPSSFPNFFNLNLEYESFF